MKKDYFIFSKIEGVAKKTAVKGEPVILDGYDDFTFKGDEQW